MDFNKIRATFQQVKQITKHQNEIKKLLSEDFNIYSILGKEHMENNTHSNFIGELLNPQGSHYFDDTFLKMFLTEVGLTGTLDTLSTKVMIEKHIGYIDKNAKTGGRIDIFLEDKLGHSISIENKINAGDQEDQIQRYCNYNQGKNKVLYLTLWGEDAGDISRGKLKADCDYQLISYKDHILNWVEDCQKEAINKETVRSGLSHYIHLIKKLTNQNMEAGKEKELHELIKTNYLEARLMADHITAVEREETYKIFEEAQSRLKEKLKEDAEIGLSTWEEWHNSWHGMGILFKSGEYDIRLNVEGQSRIWQQYTIIGFAKSGNTGEAINYIAPNGFENTGFGNGAKSSNGWHVYKHFLGWDRHEERAKLFDPIERKNIIDYIVNSILELVEEFGDIKQS
ncbi:PDDEXK-like family protein [Cyclobacterium marinum]|uniref:PDDEXK-like family protein n=1 Tax=Cyclobacterium marinum TaxID=104 RepID=UPI0011EE4561|nr:PD-(D/E)XK nuclease family protein [Cyclobacterium marinum]MBI0397979.1 PD-(D/E)XK nuclease family protein [Cyclobacterium marinum]